MPRRVRVGTEYRYQPVGWDIVDPPVGRLRPGEIVRVVKLPGCPPPGTMGHCHVAREDGTFAGLVHVNSLEAVAP